MSTEIISVDYDECDPDDIVRNVEVAVRFEGERYAVRVVRRQRQHSRAWGDEITSWSMGEDERGTRRDVVELPSEVEEAVDAEMGKNPR
jgi:hypothetical protein